LNQPYSSSELVGLLIFFMFQEKGCLRGNTSLRRLIVLRYVVHKKSMRRDVVEREREKRETMNGEKCSLTLECFVHFCIKEKMFHHYQSSNCNYYKMDFCFLSFCFLFIAIKLRLFFKPPSAEPCSSSGFLKHAKKHYLQCIY